MSTGVTTSTAPEETLLGAISCIANRTRTLAGLANPVAKPMPAAQFPVAVLPVLLLVTWSANLYY